MNCGNRMQDIVYFLNLYPFPLNEKLQLGVTNVMNIFFLCFNMGLTFIIHFQNGRIFLTSLFYMPENINLLDALICKLIAYFGHVNR